MRVLLVSEEWMDAKTLTVQPGSPFAGDDLKTHPFDLSQGVAQSIAMSVDHLHCLRMALTGTGDNVLRLHAYAPFTLLGAAVENAAIAVWDISHSSRNERILRHIRHQLTSIKKLKKTLTLAGDTVALVTNKRAPAAWPSTYRSRSQPERRNDEWTCRSARCPWRTPPLPSNVRLRCPGKKVSAALPPGLAEANAGNQPFFAVTPSA
jgi:hypothetical protein